MNLQKAVLVAVQLPQVSKVENEASLQELARLVTTLGYEVAGQFTQKRSSQKSAGVLGDGGLKALAKWTGGTGVVASMVVHKKSKAALKFTKEAEEVSIDDEDSESDELETPEVQGEPREKADIVVFDCDLSPSQLRNDTNYH